MCLLVFVFGCLLRFRSGDTTPRSKSRSRSPLRCLARMFGGRGLSSCCFFLKKIARIFPRRAPAQQRLQPASSARSSAAREDDLVSPLHMETSYVSGFF